MYDVYVIADLHFGDPDIIKFENRPFGSVDEMDEELIEKWNCVVDRDDTVFILGDFSLHVDYGKTQDIVNQLNGKKILIKGNHDISDDDTAYFNMGFDAVYSYPIIYDNFFILSHEPMYINESMPYANIFGHVHSNPIYKTYTKRSACVSAERIGYRPIKLSEVIAKIKQEAKNEQTYQKETQLEIPYRKRS